MKKIIFKLAFICKSCYIRVGVYQHNYTIELYGIATMLTKIANKTLKVAVVGLGYVGLPLAVEFGKKFDTIGFDVKKSRLDMLR